MFENWQYWPIVRPLINFMSSRKFIALALAVLVTDIGLDLSDNVQALIYMAAGAIFAVTTAAEDVAQKRAS